MEQLLYGAGGIIPNASDWYSKNSSGLNSQMVQGMNNQWNQLGASAQGFNQMQNLGMGLMGGGAAGNPFTGGGGIEKQNLVYKPAQMDNSGTSPFTMPAPSAPAPSMVAVGNGGGGGGGGGGEGYSPIGDALNSFLGAGGQGGQQGGYEDVEGMWHPGTYGGSGYKPVGYTPSMNVPTASTAGYGGYGGYSVSPAYSYPSGGGGGY